MKAARLVILAIAVGAGGLAALLAGGSPPPAPVVERAAAPRMETVDVLVARATINMGQVITAETIDWQSWPAAANTANFIVRSAQPDAKDKMTGAIARFSFVAGEPISEAKVIKADGSGFLSAILPAGMRAVSTEVSPETAAGGFILPNDRVDVILTKRERVEGGTGEQHVTESVLLNVRVLAIDQTIQEKGGEKVVVGRTATLELSQRQAETLALSRQQGTLSLALRSLADAATAKLDGGEEEEGSSGRRTLSVVRFGVTTTRTAN
jgi:pilus assembly protein CpaB